MSKTHAQIKAEIFGRPDPKNSGANERKAKHRVESDRPHHPDLIFTPTEAVRKAKLLRPTQQPCATE